jgi:hypothetical protein
MTLSFLILEFLSLWLRLITANFGLDNSSYRAQPHSIIVKYSPTGEHNKSEILKVAASRFVDVTGKEIREIKIKSVLQNAKDLCKNTKTIIRLMRLGDYRGIFTSTSSRRIFNNYSITGEYSPRRSRGEYSP